MSIVLQCCEIPKIQQIEISVSGSGSDLLEKADRTLCWGCTNSSAGVPQQEMVGSKNDTDILTLHHHDYVLIPKYSTFQMIDC
jgi:hypothetical protein